MNVLIIGSGGREYSIGLALLKSPKVTKLFFTPGNGATNRLGTNIPAKNNQDILDFALQNSIGLTIVGPEAPLTEGVVDLFKANGQSIFGPSQKAAQLEGSKVFMKELLEKYNIPTAKFLQTSNLDKASQFINSLTPPIVVKADGLCAGKGVIIAADKTEAVDAVKSMLDGSSFGQAGATVIVEEFLDGFELSVFALTDGKDYKILPAAQDHKRLLTGDNGPNTGGMGAYAPTPLASKELMQKIEDKIIKPTLDAMRSEGAEFCGVLFGGIMVVNNEPITLEFNVRFGDPECEELMTLIESGPLELFESCANGTVKSLEFKIKENSFAVGVVAASGNYPASSGPKAKITIDEEKLNSLTNAHISYAGVSLENSELYATGGRVLVAVGTGQSVKEAQQNAYEALKCVSFDGMQYRTDIAYQAIDI
jgi:phosphoribosylamine--glycine ligase